MKSYRPRAAAETPAEEAPAAGGYRATFATSPHLELGDAQESEDVVVNGVPFSAGEIAALVDYVGPSSNLKRYAPARLWRMKELLRDGVESVAAWDAVTDGAYSEHAQANEDHFGGERGDCAGATFLLAYSKAVGLMQQAVDCDDEAEAARLQNEARLSAYGAEHFLEDAFSSGHLVSAAAVADAVERALATTSALEVAHGAARRVYSARQLELGRWRIGSSSVAIDSAGRFEGLCDAGYLYTRAELADPVRQTVHERLAAAPRVLVTSPARPEPFELYGDQGPSPAAEAACLAALADARERLEHPVPGDPLAQARALWDFHRPVPTAETQALIDGIVAELTADPASLDQAVADATLHSFDDVMASVERASRGAVFRIADGRVDVPDLDRHADPARANPWAA